MSGPRSAAPAKVTADQRSPAGSHRVDESAESLDGGCGWIGQGAAQRGLDLGGCDRVAGERSACGGPMSLKEECPEAASRKRDGRRSPSSIAAEVAVQIDPPSGAGHRGVGEAHLLLEPEPRRCLRRSSLVGRQHLGPKQGGGPPEVGEAALGRIGDEYDVEFETLGLVQRREGQLIPSRPLQGEKRRGLEVLRLGLSLIAGQGHRRVAFELAVERL